MKMQLGTNFYNCCAHMTSEQSSKGVCKYNHFLKVMGIHWCHAVAEMKQF